MAHVSDWNVGWITAKRAKFTPNKTAMIYEDRLITYRELNEAVNRAANFLQKTGLRQGDRVVLVTRNCPEFLEVYFAAAKLGLVVVPLNFRLVGRELEYQVNNAAARALVFHDSFAENIDSTRATLCVDKDKYICVKSGDPQVASQPAWAADYHVAVKDFPTTEPTPERPISMDDHLTIMFTSGTTGKPKGALISHLQTYFKCFSIILYHDMRSDDVHMSHMPFCHSGGLYMIALPTLLRGATLIVRQSAEPERFAEDIEKYRVTIVVAISTMWNFILRSGKLDQIDTSSIRVLLGGGERIPEGMVDELAAKGLAMQNGMGQTENSLMLVLPKEDVLRKRGSTGLPGFFSDIVIMDQAGNELPPGEVGEMVAVGPTVMSGYWNMEEETAKVFQGGKLHTGDLAYKDEEGYVYVVDRQKDMYRSGGENVYPAEIEKILYTHPKIVNSAIIGVADEKWGETGLALIIVRKGESLTREEVLAFLTGKIARYKFPTHVEFVDDLPINIQGKIRKAELKEKYRGYPAHAR